MARRIIAQRIRTGEFLSWDVKLAGGSTTRELNGPGGLRGAITPAEGRFRGPDGLPLFREWSTALYAEDDNGRILGAGIITRITENEEGGLDIEAPGFSTYPHGIVHADTHQFPTDADPLDVYRYCWNYVQGFADGDLGVTVDSISSGVDLTTREKKTWKHDPKDPDDDEEVTIIKGYRMNEWEFIDCGEQMDSMLDLAGAEFRERHEWNDAHTAITHHIDLGLPRLGRKRDDLRFVEGENIVAAIPLTVDGDEFAQTVYGAGRGEGRKMRRTRVATRDDRLRRTALVIDKSAYDAKLDRLVRREWHRRNGSHEFESIVIRDHRHARIVNIDEGDDILVEATLDWYGPTRIWSRVISIEAGIDDDTAVLTLARSDKFRTD